MKTMLQALKERSDVELSVVVTGMHLLSAYGHTIDDIERDGFPISYRVFMEVDGRLLSTMTKSTGLGIIEFSSYFENFKPDIVVVHGDRFEAYAAATAASMMNIHVAHVGGGEVTGTIDEHLRHAITKLSHFHFPSDEESKTRIVSMGERKEHVSNTGCPSVDILLGTPEMTFEELKQALEPEVKKKEWLHGLTEDFFVVTHHPVTTEFHMVEDEIRALLEALQKFPQKIMLLWPNIDAGAEKIVKMIKVFERENDERVGVLSHMPFELFINIMRHARMMIGNSSAGVREACYFGLPVINVGNRQEGRLRTKNVIDVPGDAKEIENAIRTHLARKERFSPEHPYGDGGAGKRIADILATIPLGSSQKRLVTVSS
jgi:UDP-hydrolysing UDP-N-acetyl-D-glucosamine 2-epimerase